MPTPTLDPANFTIVPHTAIVDEFVMTNPDGSTKKIIDEPFLDKLVDHMNGREAATGDLCPIVIGHTPDEPFNEEEGPRLIGYLRNWAKGDLFETGRKASFADCWIFKADEETARRFPRRSAEIYTSLYEVDPVSFLGPTTPARDLGLLKLNRDGLGNQPRIVYTRDNDMPADTKTDAKPADKSQDGGYKEMIGLLQQILAAVTAGATPPPDAAAKPADAAPPADAAAGAGATGAGNNEQPLSDDELMKLLGESGEGPGEPMPDDAKKNEKKDKEGCTPTEKMQRELDETKMQLSRVQVESTLRVLKADGYSAANPEDKELVEDLIAMPAGGMRERAIARLKLKRDPVQRQGQGGYLNVALDNADDSNGNVKRMTPADQQNIMKLARDRKVDFHVVAREQGFKVGV